MQLDKCRKEQLMEEILEALYTDSGKEYQLCQELLEVSEQTGDICGSVFAYVYLVDACMELGKSEEKNEYFLRADQLCRDYGYPDLQFKAYNLMGLSLVEMNDEYTALEYYLKALSMVQKQNLPIDMAKIYNNIGAAFSSREEEKIGMEYYEKCLELLRTQPEKKNQNFFVILSGNMARHYRIMGEYKKAHEILDECEPLILKEGYNYNNFMRNKFYTYGKEGNKKECLKVESKIRALLFGNLKSSISDASWLASMMSVMVDLEEKEVASIYLERLEAVNDSLPCSEQPLIQREMIAYYEHFKEASKLRNAYLKYFRIVEEMEQTEEKVQAESLKSKIEFARLKREQEYIRQENAKLLDISRFDKLTGVYNVRYFQKLVSKVLADEMADSLGYIMIDVDYFKEYNDYYGHLMGDQALKAVGTILKEEADTRISICRHGGDEFACLCTDMTETEMECYVKKVETKLFKDSILHAKSKAADILTISVGFCHGNKTKDINKLYQTADQALYMAKSKGKNNYVELTCTGFHSPGGYLGMDGNLTDNSVLCNL